MDIIFVNNYNSHIHNNNFFLLKLFEKIFSKSKTHLHTTRTRIAQITSKKKRHQKDIRAIIPSGNDSRWYMTELTIRTAIFLKSRYVPHARFRIWRRFMFILNRPAGFGFVKNASGLSRLSRQGIKSSEKRSRSP